MASQNTSGCYRAIGRVARRPIRVGVQQVDEMVPVIPRSKSAPNLVPKPKRPNPMDRDPSDAINIAHTDAIRCTKSLDRPPQSSSNSRNPIDSPSSRRSQELPSSRNSQASQSSRNLQNPSSSQNVPPGISYRNQLRERVRNGGRSFLRASGSFPLYSRRMMRNIHTRWGRFREKHPAAVKYAKWVSWLSGIAASVGSAVSLQVELYRTFHVLNETDADIMTRIENVTSQLEQLQTQSEQEFQEFPDQTIFDLYHRPLRRDERGIYCLGFEDLPRSEENPTKMDPTYQDIPGFPPEIKEAELAMRTPFTTATTQSTKNLQLSHLEEGLTLQPPQ